MAAESAGIEAVIPVARWKGMGGSSTSTIGTSTRSPGRPGWRRSPRRIGIFATVHLPTSIRYVRRKRWPRSTTSPAVGSRSTWSPVGTRTRSGCSASPQRPHDDRYEVADEWISLCKQLWTSDEEFDFDGKYFRSPGAYSSPQPVQSPHPVLMSAGNSERGQHFAAKHTDLNFVVAPDIATAGTIAKNVKSPRS